jgi:hypothetical protein
MQDLGSFSIFLTQYWQLVVSLVIGSSGLAGWFLTYLDLRQRQELEARRLFRELVLTPDMLQLYGMGFDLLKLSNAAVELQQGKQPVLRLPETGGRPRKIATAKQLNVLIPKVRDRIVDLTDKVARSAVTLLLPMRLRKKEGDFMQALESCKSLNDVERARNALSEFGEELKEVLGLHILEERKLPNSTSKSEAYTNGSLIAFGIAIGYASGLLPEQNLWALTIGLGVCGIAYLIIAYRQKLGAAWNYGLQTLALALAAGAPLTSTPISWIWVIVFVMIGCLGLSLSLHKGTKVSGSGSPS